MGGCTSSGAEEKEVSGGEVGEDGRMEEEGGDRRPVADGAGVDPEAETSRALAGGALAGGVAGTVAGEARAGGVEWRVHVARVFVRRAGRVALARAVGTLREAVGRRRTLRVALGRLRTRELAWAFRAWARLAYEGYVALVAATFAKVKDGTLLRSALNAWYYHTEAAVLTRAHAARVDRLTARLRAAERRVKELEVEKDASREALHRGWVFLQQSSTASKDHRKDPAAMDIRHPFFHPDDVGLPK